MFKEDELDGEKLMNIISVFQKAGFTNFFEYSNPHLRNIRRDLRIFQCGNFCDCGSVVTKKVVVDGAMETKESELLSDIISGCLDYVDSVYLFSHWYKGMVSNERVNLERVPLRVKIDDLNEETYRGLFYDEVLEVLK